MGMPVDAGSFVRGGLPVGAALAEARLPIGAGVPVGLVSSGGVVLPVVLWSGVT